MGRHSTRRVTIFREKDNGHGAFHFIAEQSKPGKLTPFCLSESVSTDNAEVEHVHIENFKDKNKTQISKELNICKHCLDAAGSYSSKIYDFFQQNRVKMGSVKVSAPAMEEAEKVEPTPHCQKCGRYIGTEGVEYLYSCVDCGKQLCSYCAPFYRGGRMWIEGNATEGGVAYDFKPGECVCESCHAQKERRRHPYKSLLSQHAINEYLRRCIDSGKANSFEEAIRELYSHYPLSCGYNAPIDIILQEPLPGEYLHEHFKKSGFYHKTSSGWGINGCCDIWNDKFYSVEQYAKRAVENALIEKNNPDSEFYYICAFCGERRHKEAYKECPCGMKGGRHNQRQETPQRQPIAPACHTNQQMFVYKPLFYTPGEGLKAQTIISEIPLEWLNDCQVSI